jgi:hypothetical protein
MNKEWPPPPPYRNFIPYEGTGSNGFFLGSKQKMKTGPSEGNDDKSEAKLINLVRYQRGKKKRKAILY